MSSIPAAAPTRAIANRLSRHRIIAAKDNRYSMALVLHKVIDRNIELYSLLTKQPKNGLVERILTDFLAEGVKSCAVAHGPTVPTEQKNRVTFVFSKDLHKKLSSFAEREHCNQTCALTAALILYLQKHGFDPYVDYAELFLKQFQPDKPRRRRAAL